MKKLLLTFVLALFAIGASAQMKIVSPHENINVKLSRCSLLGDRITLDFVLTNNGGRDITDFRISPYEPTVAYDDEGNQYEICYGALAGREISRFTVGYGTLKSDLPTEIPVKFRVEIRDVDKRASLLPKVELSTSLGRSIVFRNIPISKN